MDNLNIHEEVSALKKLREEYEDQLKLVGFELCDLPDDVSALLEDCVELQMATHLHDLSDNYLKEYYYTKKKEAIDNFHTITQLKAEIKKQEQMLAKETEECRKLEKFTTDVNKRLVSEAEMDRNKMIMENKMKGLLERQKSLSIPEDLNIDELIKKIELLKQKKPKEK